MQDKEATQRRRRRKRGRIKSLGRVRALLIPSSTFAILFHSFLTILERISCPGIRHWCGAHDKDGKWKRKQTKAVTRSKLKQNSWAIKGKETFIERTTSLKFGKYFFWKLYVDLKSSYHFKILESGILDTKGELTTEKLWKFCYKIINLQKNLKSSCKRVLSASFLSNLKLCFVKIIITGNCLI